MTFGGFTFASDVLLGRIARFYGFAIPEAENRTPLADFVRARLHGRPKVHDEISFADMTFVVQGMEGERITRIGIELARIGPGRPSCAGQPA